MRRPSSRDRRRTRLRGARRARAVRDPRQGLRLEHIRRVRGSVVGRRHALARLTFVRLFCGSGAARCRHRARCAPSSTGYMFGPRLRVLAEEVIEARDAGCSRALLPKQRRRAIRARARGQVGRRAAQVQVPAFRRALSAVRLGPQTEYPEPPRRRRGRRRRRCGRGRRRAMRPSTVRSRRPWSRPRPSRGRRRGLARCWGDGARAAAHTTNHGRNLMLAMKATTPRF